MIWHENLVNEIGEYCIDKFGENVRIHTSEKNIDKFYEKIGTNSLPLLKNGNERKDNLYFPDIVVKDKHNQITHIIEIVESSPGAPVSVLGVIFAAEIAISIMKKEETQNKKINPKLFFIIPDPNINDNFDTYYCSICRKKHTKKKIDHLDWLKKDALEIKQCLEGFEIDSTRFFCPICNKEKNKDHDHFAWLKSKSEQVNTETITKENKLTRLFNKILENDEIRKEIENKTKNIDFPKFCYETDYRSYI